MNEEHLARYAQLLVKLGVDLRPRQPLYVYGQVAHRQLIALLTEVAYKAGSGPVETRLLDHQQHAALIRHGRFEDIELIHTEVQAWFATIVRHGAAYICLQGPEYPHLSEELARTHPERYAVYQRGLSALLDENASSHMALGFGYTRALSGGESMSPRELEELGCNPSAVHTDIMFGSKEVTTLPPGAERARWPCWTGAVGRSDS